MSLQAGAQVFEVAQMGPDFLILEDGGASLPPCSGIVTLEVDGRSRKFHVTLPEGVHASARRVHVEKRVVHPDRPVVMA